MYFFYIFTRLIFWSTIKLSEEEKIISILFGDHYFFLFFVLIEK